MLKVWSSGEILKFSQYFTADVWLRLPSWILVKILKLGLVKILSSNLVGILMFGQDLEVNAYRDSELEIWSRFALWTQPLGPLCLWQCFKRAPSLLDNRVGGCRDTYFMSAGQSHHQTLSFLFTVNQSRRHAILWTQMPWDHRLMSMCLHLQSWNECKIRLSARITAANYTTDHLRFRNLELIKKKNKSKCRGFTSPKNGPFSVKLKGKWH